MAITYDQAGVTYDSTLYTYSGQPVVSSGFPVAGVFIAFTDGPYVAAPAWTEVTTYVRGLSIHRGRSSDFDQFDTGTAQLVLDNRDRRFDPFYTSGPYYTYLTPRRQIRVVGEANGVIYEVFRGYIAGWPVEWTDAGYDSTVTIQAFDALGLMANEVVPTDWPDYYARNIGAASGGTVALRRYWRCNDSRTTEVIRDQYVGGLSMSTVSTNPVFFEQPSLAEGISGTSAGIVSYSATGTATTTYGSLWASFWVQSLVRNATDVLQFSYTIGNQGIQFGIFQNGQFYAYWSAAAGPRYAQGTLSFDPTRQPFHVFIHGVDGNINLLINGVYPTYTTSVSALSYQAIEKIDVQYGIYSEIAVGSGTPSPGSVVDMAKLFYNATTLRFSETTTARMQRLIGTTDYPAALQGFTAAPVATVSEIGTGTGVVPEMQLVADSEGGEIYVSKTGVLTTTSRFDVFNATRSANSQATFTDSGVGLRYGTDLLIEYDADNLKNDTTVEFSGDGEVNAYSDAVIEAYGGAATTIETQLDSPTSAAQLATLELGVQGSLVPRISPIDVSVNTAAADWQTILGLELLDRVTFKRTPTVGNQFDRAALINAIDHQIEPGVWRTQLTLSMRYTSPLTLDDDVLGTLDFNYLG
jgi:hypothetical protein